MNGDRAIVIYGGALLELRREVINLIGEDMGAALLFRYGFRCGKLTARSLGIQPEPHEILDFLQSMCAEAGIGEVFPLEVTDSHISLRVDKTIDEEYGKGGDFTRGYIAGIFSEFSGKSFYCVKEDSKYYLTEGDFYKKEVGNIREEGA